jgi:hypothetical protein
MTLSRYGLTGSRFRGLRFSQLTTIYSIQPLTKACKIDSSFALPLIFLVYLNGGKDTTTNEKLAAYPIANCTMSPIVRLETLAKDVHTD